MVMSWGLFRACDYDRFCSSVETAVSIGKIIAGVTILVFNLLLVIMGHYSVYDWCFDCDGVGVVFEITQES